MVIHWIKDQGDSKENPESEPLKTRKKIDGIFFECIMGLGDSPF